ncbi:MAG: DUF5011 domain-containing protein [Bacteroidota bacterium]
MKFKTAAVVFLLSFLLFLSCKKKDDSLPLITLKGEALVIVVLNTPYTDAGATATDPKDGDISVSAQGEVNTNFAGTYYITYTAYDAAGNQGNATRVVEVRNSAQIYSGTYRATNILTPDTIHYTSAITTSTVLNNRIWLVGIGTTSNASVFADIRHDTILVPHQLTHGGSPLATHGVWGSGLISTLADTLILEINYTDSISGTTANGKTIYKKKY